MARILLCMETSSEYDRAVARGIVKYSQENGNCLSLSRVPPSMVAGSKRGRRIVNLIKDMKADAIIGRWPYKDLLPLKALEGVSVVLQNIDTRSTGFSTLTGEYVRTGKIAAEFFLGKALRTYAFFGVRNIIWSEERAQGFREVIRSHGRKYQELMVDNDPMEAIDDLQSWLLDLPKPAAVFCCDDSYALCVSEQCGLLGINVPQDVLILGVDNDELLCNIANPPLSSIVLDAEKGGYEVARRIHEGGSESFTVLVKPGVIVQRGSTRRHDVKDPDIRSIVEFIDENFTKNITAEDIFSQACVCRRTAEIKFRQETGLTIHRYLVEQRINHLCALLDSTDMPVIECAYRSGINDPNYLFHVFKKVKGCSPGDYRKQKI